MFKTRMRCVFLLVFLVGCTSTKLDTFDSKMAAGRYDDAKVYALKEKNNILWTLQAAAAAGAAGQHEESNKLYDLAEEKYIAVRRKSGASDKLGAIAQLLVNDNVIPYKGEVHDGIMINANKALNFILLGEWALARVELNRAYDRQRRAADFYSQEIQNQQETANKNGFSINLGKAMIQPDLEKLRGVEAYADYVIPLVNLLEIIYLTHRGDADDSERLRQSKNRLLAMTQSKQLKKNLKNSKDYTWIIIENGQSPRKIEWRIDFPVGIFSGLMSEFKNLRFVSVALPKLQQLSTEYYTFRVNGEDCDLITDMDKVVEAEFSRAMPNIVARALISTAIRAITQYKIGKNKGQTTAFFVGIAQAFSTQADLRLWSALPKSYNFAIVPSGIIKLNAYGELLQEVKTIGDSLLYFKISRDGHVSLRQVSFN